MTTSAELASLREEMVERQLRSRGIRDERVLAAMARVPRELFVPPDLRGLAYADEALPIGFGQSISQPYMVALICELLALHAGSVVGEAEDARREERAPSAPWAGGERVLDVGAGSGYQAAVLAELAGEVDAIERLPELADAARAGLADAGYADRVRVHLGDGTLGLPARAPFAGIAVAAAAPRVPPALYDQLEEGGRLVVPVGGGWSQRLEAIVRTPGGPEVVHSVACRFVPLLGAEGF